MSIGMLRTFVLMVMLAFACSSCAKSPDQEIKAVRAIIGDAPVVLLATKWCGYCKKQRQDFKRLGVAYKEYDVENDEIGERAYDAVDGNGVPIVIIGNEIIDGYDAESVRDALNQQGLLPKPS